MSGEATRGLIFNEPLIFERGAVGRSGIDVPSNGFKDADPAKYIKAELLRGGVDGMSEVSEPEVVRHFTRLSQWNFGVDSGFYPLGSCTMKYNPKVNEFASSLEGFTGLHPLQGDDDAQGALQLMYELEKQLCEITGMDSGSLQPSAGAAGELCGLMVIRAAHEARGNARRKVILPDSAHGTNPASAALCNYEVAPLASGPDGLIDLKALEAAMDEDTAALMLTNPNTLGLFEKNIKAICDIVHAKGGYVYADGANLNALLGKGRFGDMGIDVCHVNLHKTFGTPHGGGGPGSGPCLVKKELAPYLPVPRVEKKKGRYQLNWTAPKSIGALHAFHGNFGVLVRAYSFILASGSDGLEKATEAAVLNANYIRAKLNKRFHVPYPGTCMHECVLSDKNQQEHGISTLDMAKALIDRGYHPPTIYFPLIVKGAMMIEPTESETLQTIDGFIAAMLDVADKAVADPESLHNAPVVPKVRRMDETTAARKPDLRYRVK